MASNTGAIKTFMSNFLDRHELTAEEFEKIYSDGPINNRNQKILRDFKARSLASRIIKPLYEKLQGSREKSDTSTTKSEVQVKAIKKLLKGVERTEAFEIKGAPKEVERSGQGAPIRSALKEALGVATATKKTKGLTGKAKQKEAKRIARSKNIKKYGNLGIDTVAEIAEGIQKRRPSVTSGRKPFGRPSDSSLLNKYDKIINLIRPDQTRTQKLAGAVKPYTDIVGGGLGKFGGQLAAGPLGKLATGALGTTGVGGGLASLLGSPALLAAGGAGVGAYGLSKLVNSLSQESNPFEPIAKRLRDQRGFIPRTRSGLGSLISSQDESFLPSLARSIGLGGKQTRLQKFRNKIGGAISGEQPGLGTKFKRGFGDFLSDPNAAEKIRDLMETGQILYGISGDIGLNKLIGRGVTGLGRKLGLVSKQQPGGDSSGGNMGSMLAQYIAGRGGDVLSQQSRGIFDRPFPVNRERMTQDMLEEFGPQMTDYDILQSNIGIQKAKRKVRREALKKQRVMDNLRANLDQTGQEQGFQERSRNLALTQRENMMRQQANAIQNRIDTEQMLAGQKVNLNAPIIPRERIGPNVIDKLNESFGRNIADPLARQYGESLVEGFKQK